MINFEAILSDENFKKLYSLVQRKEKINVKGLNKGERALILSGINKNTLYVASSNENANAISTAMRYFGRQTFETIDLVDSLIYKSNSLGVVQNLIDFLTAYCKNSSGFFVVTCNMLLQKLPKKEDFIKKAINFSINAKLTLESVKKELISLGYNRVEALENKGEFSLRGDCLDIFPNGYEDNAIRIEFFGDYVESIKKIDCVEYKTLESLENYCIYPNTLLLDSENTSIESYVNLPKQESFVSSFFEWFGDDVIAIEDAKRCYDIANQIYWQKSEDIKGQIRQGLVTKDFSNFYNDTSAYKIKRRTSAIAFNSFEMLNPIFYTGNNLEFTSVQIPNYKGKSELFMQDLDYYSRNKFTVLIYCQDDEKVKIMSARLDAMNFNYVVSSDDSIEIGKINLVLNYLYLSAGFQKEKLILISTPSLFMNTAKLEIKKDKNRVFYLPKVNDYVVHEVYGIGKCIGIEKLNSGIVEKDYFIIQYAKGDIIYLPTENAEEISAYLGGELEPKLNSLGSEQFKKAKEKARASIREMAFDLKKLYAEREMKKGFAYPIDDYIMEEFENSRGFELTDDQASAIQDIKNDMESGKIMDRLICGDVGFGKTEVALVTAFKTILAGKQVAFLAPTTILCHQHYQNVKKRMANFLINVGCLNRFISTKECNEVFDGLASGKINIVCGTHKLLSDKVKFQDLGLLILDEEQRFGVSDKEKIKNMKSTVNVLTLSATPIPRTLNMAMVGIRDVSLITTPPKDRLPPQTYVMEYSDEILYEACNRELRRSGQVLVVYNRVEDILKVVQKVKSLFPDVSVGYAHGQMKRQMMEIEVAKLYSGETQILVATSLIENGIDLPSANTIFVIDADNMGLSQLYQLRGRVGRSDRLSYAYFTYDKQKLISDTAFKRLEALREFNDLGSGFKVAMRDLELRGAGTILGAEQSGHIEKIGYNLYCKILDGVMKEISGNNYKGKKEVKIDIALPAFLNVEVVTSETERMKIYNEISTLSSYDEKEKIINKYNNAYSKLGEEFRQLVTVGLIKFLSQQIDVKRIMINEFNSFIEFYELDKDTMLPFLENSSKFNGKFGLDLKNENRLIFKSGASIKEKQDELINFLANFINSSC